MKFMLNLIVSFSMVCIMSQAKELSPLVVDHWKAMMRPYHEVCLNETQIDPEIPNRLFGKSQFPDEKLFHCYLECMHEKLKFLVDGKFSVNNMVAAVYMLNAELAQKCVDDAHSVEEKCARSYVLVQCVAIGVAEE
ncbi:hypothetical protein PPYR_09170 [Photinus pyralis]|uniref:Uncharacterized protein n=1 Tax=Photinus pyralis TaxID=7054 RepID=A0A5N4ALI0_PHOPY|nr:uncharacterized protein LOC116170576 [Photinus pyralis]KAB0798177.1 hypothetical protein PPYR_09170 [Photinus pyralis]